MRLRHGGRAGRRFAGDKRGAVAPMFGVLFAFALLPLGGAAIDFSRVLTGRAALQDALDAASLALGKMPVNSTADQLQAAADMWVQANFHDQDVENFHITVTPSYADSSTTISKIQLAGDAAVKSIFNGDIGGVTFGQYPLGARSTVSWGLQRVEVALVLDNTGSMMESDGSGSTKSATLKQATKDLIDTLSQMVATTGDKNVFRVGMVPFATYVNVGAANKGAWITGTSPYANDIFTTPTDRFALFTKMGQAWAGCVESRPMPYDIQDTAPDPAIPNSMYVPYFAPDEPDDIYNKTDSTTGAVTQYDVYYNNYLPDGVDPSSTWTAKQGNPAKYQSAPARAHPSSIWGSTASNGPNKDCPNVPLIPLTTDYAAVKTAIDNLAPAGNTHIPLGLVWGWTLLSPSAPFSDGMPYGSANVRKVVILVTDGNNTYFAGSANPATNVNNGLNSTQNGWVTTDNSLETAYGYVWQQRIAQDGGSYADPALAMNDRLKKLCANMKAAGVTLYTIPLRVDDANTKAMLQTCASTPDNYLEANSGADLTKDFQNIAGQITAMRLSH